MRAPPRVVWPCGPPWLCAEVRTTRDNGSTDRASAWNSSAANARARPCVGAAKHMERARNFVAVVAAERAGTARMISWPLRAVPQRRRPVRSSVIAIAVPLAWWLLTAGPMGSSCGRRARSIAVATGRAAIVLALGVAATGCGDVTCAMAYYGRLADPCARAQPNPRDPAWGCSADTLCPCGAPCPPPSEDLRRSRCAVPGAQVPACVPGNVR
jgi:hypothetical protein